MRKDTLYITLSRDITSYTITSGQRAIATNVNYAVTIESPTLTTNLAGRDVSVIISDTEGDTLTTATTFYPDTKNPYKAVTGSLLLDGAAYAKFFDGKPVDTAVRLPIVIRDKSATLLSSDIVVMNGGENAEPSASDETVAGLVNAIRFYDLAEFKAWLDGTKTRDDGLLPTDIVVGQWVHTQQDGSFICKELIGAEPSVAKNFTAIVTQFPLTGTLKMNPDNGVGLSVYSGDVYNEAEATSFSTDEITYKCEAFTFKAGDNQIARQKDNYALENRVNSTMKSTLDAVKADNDETYAAMLPVRDETVEARDRAETAARGAKASETRAVTAEENAATSEQNAEASKKSAAVSEANAGLYRQQALAYSQKAETEASTATTKATEASDSALSASAHAGAALEHEVKAGEYEASAKQYAEASYHNAESAASSAAASRSSADTAAQSESIAAGSAAAAASSESMASQYKDTAVSASSLAVTSKDSASNFADAASKSAAASASSAASSAASASQASESAAVAEAQVTDTLKRINFAGGRFFSQYYNGNALGITYKDWVGDKCIMAWNDRYIIISENYSKGWMTVNGQDFSFIASAPYHYNAYLYHHTVFCCLGFNGERVAIFYRFSEYDADKGRQNYAEVLDASTGEVLIEKTFTNEEMTFIKAAPCWKMEFTCILKNGDMLHRGTIFSGEDLSIKGYVATEAGFRVLGDRYSTYCCYLTANADNGYSGEDPIIVQSNDGYSFWVDDRYTLDESGNPIVTLRNFLVDGIFSETSAYSRDVCVLFSNFSEDWGHQHKAAIVRNPFTGKLAAYAVALDDTRENRIVFTKHADINATDSINAFIPVNFRVGGLIYQKVAYYLKRGPFIYAVNYNGTVFDNPCAVLTVSDNNVRYGVPQFMSSVAYTNTKYYRPLPVTRFFANNASLIYPVENI